MYRVHQTWTQFLFHFCNDIVFQNVAIVQLMCPSPSKWTLRLLRLPTTASVRQLQHATNMLPEFVVKEVKCHHFLLCLHQSSLVQLGIRPAK